MDLKNILKTIKLQESTISMALGAIVIVIVGVLAINLVGNRKGETIPPIEVTNNESLPTTHTVAQGESLSSIAEKYYGYDDWREIARENNINDPNKLVAGQKLTIPAIENADSSTNTPTQKPIATPTPTAAPIATEKTKHKVTEGESLWKIAEDYYESGYNWVDIARENKISNPGIITVGQEISIPKVEAKSKTIAETKMVVNSPDPISGATYTVVKGDNLWEIAIRAYGDGYKWVEIAKENSLKNPSLIHSGNTLSLPR